MLFAPSGKGRKRQKKGEKGRFRPISRKGGQTPLEPPFCYTPICGSPKNDISQISGLCRGSAGSQCFIASLQGQTASYMLHSSQSPSLCELAVPLLQLACLGETLVVILGVPGREETRRELGPTITAGPTLRVF